MIASSNRAIRRVWTAEQDAALAQAYQQHRQGAITRLSLEWGIPFTTLHNRAIYQLKLSPVRHARPPRAWTAAEDQIVIDYGYLPARLLVARLAAAGFQRGASAIEVRRSALRRRGAPVDAARPGLTVAEVAAGLGCAERTVYGWVRRGQLKPKRLGPGVHQYVIPHAALRQFCQQNPLALANCRPDLVWYTDLLSHP